MNEFEMRFMTKQQTWEDMMCLDELEDNGCIIRLESTWVFDIDKIDKIEEYLKKWMA